MPTVESILAANPAIQSAQAGQVTVQRGTYELTAAQAQDATLEVLVVRLPAQHRIVELTVEVDDLDSGATGTVDVGLKDTVQDPADTTDLTLFATGLSIQAASINTYKTQATQEVAAVNYDRYIAVNVNAAATTGIAAGIACELVSRPDLATHEGNFS